MSALSSLEVVQRAPRAAARSTPILFVHGAYVGAWCWDEHFLPYFAQHGYAAYALSLRGHGGSAGRESLDQAGLDDYLADVVEVAESLPAPPILVGHSMGAIVVQRALRRGLAPGAVLLTPVPQTGLAWAAMLLALREPHMFHDLNLMQYLRLPPRMESLRKAVFSDRVADGHALRHLRRMQPESSRALFELSWPQAMPFDMPGMPLLVLGAGEDALFPPWMTRAGRSGSEVAEIIPGMAHAMMLDPQWRIVADRMLRWLKENGF